MRRITAMVSTNIDADLFLRGLNTEELSVVKRKCEELIAFQKQQYPTNEEIRQVYELEGKIPAIKFFRERVGRNNCGLKYAKEHVENLAETFGWKQPQRNPSDYKLASF